MKLLILSDLHNEFQPFQPVPTDADVVILAGDIDVKARSGQWAASTFGSLPVVMVAGNHDLWGSSIPRGYEKMKEAVRGSHVHFLQNDQVVIDGVRFLGCTLWTDYRLTGNQPLAMWDARQRMTRDFKKNPQPCVWQNISGLHAGRAREVHPVLDRTIGPAVPRQDRCGDPPCPHRGIHS
jgi:predicted MPP superfamily phosphohydrolase